MPSIEYRPNRPKPYRARYWGPDGRLHSRSFARKDDAERTGRRKIGPRSVPRGPIDELERRGFFEAQSK